MDTVLGPSMPSNITHTSLHIAFPRLHAFVLPQRCKTWLVHIKCDSPGVAAISFLCRKAMKGAACIPFMNPEDISAGLLRVYHLLIKMFVPFWSGGPKIMTIDWMRIGWWLRCAGQPYL